MLSLNKPLSLSNLLILSFILAASAKLSKFGGPFAHLSVNNGKAKNSLRLIKTPPGITFPGTKWCGPGDIAEDENDLGELRETDMCCRAHDLCDDLLLSGEEDHGLKNSGWFTILNCKCDRDFFDCLHNSNHTVSKIIGSQYFFFRDTCYMEAPPIEECLEYQETLFAKRCIKYRFDETKPDKYQWFDLPFYDADYFPTFDDDMTMSYNGISENQRYHKT